MIKIFLLSLLTLYQKFFTLIGYGSCRYYPSCSQYAREQFTFNPLHIAFYKSAIRILKCNQLFDGGIDYPLLYNPKLKPNCKNMGKIKYWIVPKGKNSYYLIKQFTKGTSC